MYAGTSLHCYVMHVNAHIKYLNFSVVKCPLIKKTDGEVYDITCTTDTKVYNDTCEVSCELGYNLTSSDGVHKCTENGTWSNNVTCERMLCLTQFVNGCFI